MSLLDRIFNITNEHDFETLALEMFRYQFDCNAVYRTFCTYLKRTPDTVFYWKDIPFLPIQFFKTHSVYGANTPPEMVFSSSGTTGMQTSKHQVKNLSVYQQSFRNGFTHFYGKIEDYVVLALLPSYLERKGSSLIYMADDFIKCSAHPESGFFLNEWDKLAEILKKTDQEGKKVLLIGVSFALLDLVEKHQFQLQHTIVMETGGMKGRRKELVREELHSILKKGFGVSHIHSEYGMTELLSQAYSFGKGVFKSVPWMKVLTRDTNDALSWQSFGKTGGVNIIDLANLHSCSFIATQDLGVTYNNNTFEIKGRFDNADIRGCNLMIL